MPFACHSLPSRVVLFLLAMLTLTQAAIADGDKHARRLSLLPKYQEECSACHLAYPPAMLPAASWQRLMGRLANHFGTDASLEPKAVKELSNWLADNAATGKRASAAPADDRITRSSWFIREHREVSAVAWKLPAVKSASNCGACHLNSELGDFNEHNVRIPR